MTPQLHILAKAPVPGWTKTRLAPVLGATGAARIARRQLVDTVEIARHAGFTPVTLWSAPGCWHPALRALARCYGLRLRSQGPGDLGARMFHVARAAARSNEWPILLGTDCVALCTQDLVTARDALQEGADAVIGPANDGGYYLFGLRRPHPALFRGIPWSTDKVFEYTLTRLRQSGLRFRLLPPRRDLDRPADLGWCSPHAIARAGWVYSKN